jgi:hypothetical protein
LKRELPVALTAIVGLILIMDYFFKITWLSPIAGHMQNWGVIIAAFALALAAVNLFKIHSIRISRRNPGMLNSIVLLGGLLAMVYSGIFLGRTSKPFDFMFQSIYTPLAAAFYAMTAFNLASAAYRAFRARSVQAAILLVTGVLLMLGRAPIGEVIWDKFPTIANWIMSVGNLAGSRGIMISIAVGTIGVSLRVLVGVDRAHLGTE